MMILLIGCGKTRIIYRTEIKECEIKEPKLIRIDPILTDPVQVPYWTKKENPKYINLKELYLKTKEGLKLCNGQLIEIEKTQNPTKEKTL